MLKKKRTRFQKQSKESEKQDYTAKRKQIVKQVFKPYKEMFGWINSFTFNFIKRDAKYSLLTSLPVESVFATIDNLAPKEVIRNARDNAGPFYIQGNNIGILLTHGFSATAQEMQGLGELLHKEGGYSTFSVLLAGHGTSPADLSQTGVIDWYKSIKEGCDFLKERCDKVILVGHSMGGTLSFILAANEHVDGIVSLCTPIKVEYFMQDYLHLVNDLVPYFPRTKHEVKVMEENNLINYRKSSLKAVDQLLDLMEIAREEISKVTAPIFTITAGRDERVPLYNAERIHELVKSEIKRDYLSPNSGHTILFDSTKEEREKFTQMVLEFIAELVK